MRVAILGRVSGHKQKKEETIETQVAVCEAYCRKNGFEVVGRYLDLHVRSSVPTEELAGQLGLGRGTARNSPIWHTVERIVRFRFAAMPSPGELDVYTEVSPGPARQLERLAGWCRDEHERLFGQHLDGLARAAGQAPTSPEAVPPAHLRMARRLDQLAEHTSATAGPISR